MRRSITNSECSKSSASVANSKKCSEPNRITEEKQCLSTPPIIIGVCTPSLTAPVPSVKASGTEKQEPVHAFYTTCDITNSKCTSSVTSKAGPVVATGCCCCCQRRNSAVHAAYLVVAGGAALSTEEILLRRDTELLRLLQLLLLYAAPLFHMLGLM
ncbi:unnamed protein product [Rangifer tarandus platyrhynchus]|uniref:Uncharacterized protein n=1 Tax=Rangifer tarandus platyrhynchus TaxID=3082113 RepID=A0ABN8XMQ5_RANTA|nr:unnamed protein product [Rangifer tarandus platyrhynchus]